MPKEPPERQGTIIRLFLEFLDKHFATFPPYVQSLIGVVVLLLLVHLVLNAFVAPTVVQGDLSIATKTGGGKRVASYRVVLAGGDGTETNASGAWALPLPQRGLPIHRRLDILPPLPGQSAENVFPDDQTIGHVYFWAPIPIWDALERRYVSVLVDPDETGDKRVRVEFLRVAAGSTTDEAVAWAATTPETSVTAKHPVPERAHVLALRDLRISKLPYLLRSTGRIYCIINVDGHPLSDAALLAAPFYHDRPGRFSTGALGVPPGQVVLPLRFPIASLQDSWLPVSAGDRKTFEGIAANLGSVVVANADTAFEPRAKGRVELRVLADNQTEVAALDITDAIAQPNRLQRLLTADGNVELGVWILDGWFTPSGYVDPTIQALVDRYPQTPPGLDRQDLLAPYNVAGDPGTEERTAQLAEPTAILEVVGAVKTVDAASPTDLESVVRLLGKYKLGMERESIARLVEIYPDMPSDELKLRTKFFQTAANVELKLSEIQIASSNGDVVVSFQQESHFRDIPSNQTVPPITQTLRMRLKRAATSFTIAEIQKGK